MSSQTSMIKAAVVSVELASKLDNHNFCFVLKQGVSLGKEKKEIKVVHLGL